MRNKKFWWKIKKNYENNKLKFEELKKKFYRTRKIFSQTYILYDRAGVVRPTFVTELRQYVDIFSRFTIFSPKNNSRTKHFLRDNPKNVFSLHKGYTGEKQFALSLRKLDGTPAKFFSNEINIAFILRTKKFGRKRKIMDNLTVIDSVLILAV